MSHCFYISQNLTNIRKDHWSPLVFVLSRTFRPGAVVHYLVQDIYIWEKSLWDVWKVQHWWGLCIAMLHTSVPFPFHLRCWQLPLARMQAVQRALKCRICMILPQRFPPREAEKESIHRDSTGCAMFCHVLPVVGSKDQTILHDLPVFCSMFWNSFWNTWNVLKHLETWCLHVQRFSHSPCGLLWKGVLEPAIAALDGSVATALKRAREEARLWLRDSTKWCW